MPSFLVGTNRFEIQVPFATCLFLDPPFSIVLKVTCKSVQALGMALLGMEAGTHTGHGLLRPGSQNLRLPHSEEGM